jgi:alpha-amylase
LLATTADKSILAFLRKNGSNEVLVFINFSQQKINFQINDTNLAGEFINVFNKDEKDFTAEKYIELAPWDYKVFEKK